MNRKIKKLLLSIAMLITILPILKSSLLTVEAKSTYTYYNFQCTGGYEVDTIDNDGNFVYSSCQYSFDNAKSAMNSAGRDAVVRDRNAYSVNQIVAMTRGYVYSYSVRGGRYTLIIQQNTSAYDAKTTYINNCRMLNYEDTLSYGGDGTGTVLVKGFGFEGDVELQQVDLVPSKFVELGKAIWMGGNDATPNPDAEWQVIPRAAYYTAEKNGNYTDLVYYCFNGVADSSGYGADISYGGLHVGVAPSWMEVGKKYYSWNDTDFYSDLDMKNYVNSYYNYYQYVSYRTKSNIPASVYNSYLSNAGRDSNSKLWDTGDRFIADQDKYGMNAAMVFVQACDESAYGSSYYAQERNNLFGVAAYDANPDDATSFSSIDEAIDYQMGGLLRNYCNTISPLFFGDHFGNKGSGITVKYASSNYYGLVLASMYYNFDKFANSYSGSLTDYQSSCIGIVNDTKTNIYADPNGSQVMYTTEYGPTYQKDYTVSILGETGDYYKIQSTDYISNGQPMTQSWGNVIDYNWSTMIGYIKKSDIKTMIGSIPSIHVNSVTLSSSSLSMSTGLTRQLTATIDPSNASNPNVKWDSTNTSIATVDANGLVTAVAAGTVTIRATSEDGNHVASCQITIESQETKIKSFITSLYRSVLSRDPDDAGMGYWYSALSSGSMTGSQAIQNSIFGPEFTEQNYCNEHFITRLYQCMLRRDPDAAGLSYWVSKLDGGEAREAVVNECLQSEEFTNWCEETGIAVGDPIPVPSNGGTIQNWPCPLDNKLDSKITDFVLRMYTMGLGRDGEKAGVAYWVDQIHNQGYSGSAFARYCLFSEEFIGQNNSNGEFVTRLYRVLLDREPEAAGYNYWTTVLDQGESRESVFDQCVAGASSLEWSRVCAAYGIKM